MTRIVFMGPPGVGKGTQAARLAAEPRIPTISTGDIFRDSIRRRTPLGIELRDMIEAGNYVPDATTNAVVAERLERDDCADGFILDGYPRTRAQVHELDRVLRRQGCEVDVVIVLSVSIGEIVQRIAARAVEQGRPDDTPDVIRHRIEVYERETAELIEEYEGRGCVSRIDGVGTPDEVAERILDAIRVRP